MLQEKHVRKLNRLLCSMSYDLFYVFAGECEANLFLLLFT
jgi:hypothetical protein